MAKFGQLSPIPIEKPRSEAAKFFHDNTHELDKLINSYKTTPYFITPEEFHTVHQRWQRVCRYRDHYLDHLSEYPACRFPFQLSSVSLRRPILTPSFSYRFYKACVRSELLNRLPEYHWKTPSFWKSWVAKHSSSFRECLEALEVSDYRLEFNNWLETEQYAVKRSIEDFGLRRSQSFMPFDPEWQIIYPYHSDERLELPDRLEELLASRRLSTDLKRALLGAWRNYRRHWTRTARCEIWNLENSEDAYRYVEERLWHSTVNDGSNPVNASGNPLIGSSSRCFRELRLALRHLKPLGPKPVFVAQKNQ